MDALLIIIAIVYAIASSFSKSNKAKKQSQARKKTQRPTQSFEQMMAEEFAKPQKKQQSTMLDIPAAPVKKKKKKAPVIAESTPRKAPLQPTSRAEHDHAHKAAIAPTKREEHEHEHKAPLKSRLNNRSYAGIKSKYQSSPLEVQILAESSAQTPHAAGFKLKTDPEALIEGIVWNEVLGKPKGLRR